MMLGIIVDDAIVVGEHTASRYEDGDAPFEAAEKGANRMLTPVMAAMTTTVAAFAPMLLISGVIGQIMGVMPYVVIAVILASLTECFLILPGHLAHTLQSRPVRKWSFWRQMSFAMIVGSILIVITNRFSDGSAVAGGFSPFDSLIAWRADMALSLFLLLVAIGSLLAGTLFELVFWTVKRINRKSGDARTDGRFRRWFDKGFNAFRDGPFTWLVGGSYRWRYVTVAIAIASVMIVAVGLIRGDHIKFVFFPSPEAENIRARIVFNAGIPEERAIGIMTEVEDSLDRAVAEFTNNRDDLVTAVFATFGQAGPSVGDNLAEFRVQLSSSELRTVRTPEIVKAWRKALPKIAGTRRIAIFETRGGPPGRDLDVEITGGNAAELKQAANAVIPIVSGIEGVSGVSDDLPFGKPELVMELLPRGAALGFTIDDVGRQVRNAFDGAIPATDCTR